VDIGPDGLRVRMDRRPTALDYVTRRYPGSPTDLLPPAIAYAAVSDGASMVTETGLDGPCMRVEGLVRLGAASRTAVRHETVRGRERLSGAPVRATDIRAGAGLVLAGLCAEGYTEVSHAHHIDRGYPRLVEQLRRLGASVDREQTPPEPTFILPS